MYDSFLDGGFMEAAKYLRRPDTPMDISVALIDVDIKAIDRILGITPSLSPSSKASTLSSLHAVSANVLSLTSAATSQVVPVVEKTKQLFGGIGQKFASFSIWNNNTAHKNNSEKDNYAGVDAMRSIINQSKQYPLTASTDRQVGTGSTPFVIDGDDEEEEHHMGGGGTTSNNDNSHSDHSPHSVDSNTISISRTDQQRQQGEKEWSYMAM
jgi:hypothetical protein